MNEKHPKRLVNGLEFLENDIVLVDFLCKL
jgi:hypothetical protein